MTPPRTRKMQGKPKFRVGQVCRVVGSEIFRSFLPDYFRVAAITWYDDSEQYGYQLREGATKGPWVAEKHLRPLTDREAGRAQKSR